MKPRCRIVSFLLPLLLLTLPAGAESGSRSAKRLGLGIGLITEPFPSLLGFTLAYNISSRLRATAGYGSLSATGSNFEIDIKTYGLNLKFFPLDWNFAPFLECGASSLTGTINGTGSANGISVSNTGVAFSAGGGLDWQTGIGFNLGLSYKVLFAKDSSSVAAPGFHLGWFF